jgi:pyruvate/2-oxoacid:ferredoxin oxidoreductase beta subunit/Pyruvate/2-oxoacid:ferredoxin oxidoreductase gamma subunit
MSQIRYTTYMTDEMGPLPFCPGCGHERLIKALDKALVKHQPDPRDVVIVTDIGCIGLSDRYFCTNAFHGLHGRSITYACGLKLARPELTVVVLKGDGGCGIGGAHLLNAARRNIGITVLIANNFNYGMTGGQHSVTTPTDGVTSSTRWGNIEAPMDLCGTSVAAGAAWVYRATTFDEDLSEVIGKAIAQPGFSQVDIWELCTANYVRRNKLKKKDLLALMERHGLRSGLQVNRPRPEYSVRYQEICEASRKVARTIPPIEPSFSNAVGRQTGIVIAGGAGQKIRSSSTLFAKGAIFAGLRATQKDDYPITVRTGHSISEVILSPEPIDYTGIDSPDFFVLLSASGLARLRSRIEGLPPTAVVYADESLELPEMRARVRKLPTAEIGRRIGRPSMAIAALAAMLEDSGIFPTEAFGTAIESFQSGRIAGQNLKAVSAGAELMKSKGIESAIESDEREG